MSNLIKLFEFPRESLVIIIGAIVKFVLHLYIAPGYGFFFDELYTIALSRHLAFGYVDLPPLVPALVALSRFLLGESLFAMHIVPALAGSFTLVFACLVTKEFGGKTFAVALTALGFITVPGWLMVDSIFCYDSIDQLILAAFLFYLIRFLRTGNKRLWIALGSIAGLACMTKMTIVFLGLGFLFALLASKFSLAIVFLAPFSDGHSIGALNYGDGGRTAGLILMIPGFLLMQVAEKYLDKQFSVQVTLQENHKLIQNGPYRFIRHPRYLGILSFFLGISLLFRSLPGMLLIIALALVFVWRIYTEESLMHKEFGKEWEAYCDQSWCIFPFIF